AVVPQTPVEAGAAAGTLALPWLLPARVAGPVASRVARVAGGAVGGETGGQLAGEATGQGALVGGGGAAVGESVGAGASKLARALPWMKGAIAAQDERRLTNVVGDAVEPFAGRDLRSLGSGEGRKLLRTDREGRIAAIEQAIGNQPINVPSLGGPMPLRDALDALSNVGVRLGQHPADRSVRQVPDALDYKTIIGEIRAGLDAVDPSRKASAAFDTAQDVYRGGKTLIKQVLAQEGLYNVHGQFNSAAAQRILANPRRAELLRERVGDDVYGALVEAAYRGATPAAGRDKLASGAGGPLDAAREWARGTNTGATQVVGVPLRTILPNLGSQYVGRAPFSLPPALQAILDVALQKAGGAGLSGEQR
ncbi:MAG TPA: hypothetical protein VEA38_16105, partial [Terriglobales bacterium]|nr:hypothetical protein [Terriglobales bacterium]